MTGVRGKLGSICYGDDDELARHWYVSLAPYEYGWNIKITGKEMRGQFGERGEIEYNAMAAVVHDINLNDRVRYTGQERPGNP